MDISVAMNQVITRAEEEAVKANGGKQILKYLPGMLKTVFNGAYNLACEHFESKQSKEVSEFKQTIFDQNITIDSLKGEVRNLTVTLEAKDKVISELQDTTDASGQYNRRDNFKIMGVPQQDDENLFEIAKSVTKHIGREISETEISDIHRLPSPNTTNSTNNVPGIIVRVNRRTIKQDILDKKKMLRTQPHADYPNLAIYEDLTPLRSRMLYALRNKTKDGNKVFKFTWSKQGRIYCRTEQQSKPGPDRKLPRPSIVNKPNDLLKLGFTDQEVKEIIQNKRK